MQRSRHPERRNTVRVPLQVPLTIRCNTPEGDTVDLKASTHTVGANGALVMMDVPLVPGQRVHVVNELTSEIAECTVTTVRDKRECRFIGMGFLAPRPDFWRMVFPKAGTRQAVRSARTGALLNPGLDFPRRSNA